MNVIKPKGINLTLQGGRSHGAFTWGVLDRLLQDDCLEIEAMTGAISGAINAAIMVYGYAKGGREGAGDSLRNFWNLLSMESIEFDYMRSNCQTKLFLATAHVRTGKLKIFENCDMSIDTLLASACLPSIHHPVQIDGEIYRDGGLAANPPVFLLIFNCKNRDIINYGCKATGDSGHTHKRRGNTRTNVGYRF
ncbi:MAG: patatin-like phospholipase family protein [Gammaproteobacteria bacterium]